ncbi:la-related protein 1C-like isoform X2 [Cornus florida]|uniref:la-related protein 1C-like isoform X2 n=1 Tax=Cornus florida TaxID=4283 RepID=UPI002897EA8A|nr:la-related protein 1C-like isoform X2 [Cornus florida]
MAAASNSNHQSPKHAGGDRQAAAARGVASPVASPWTQIVRGGESESIVSSSTSAAAAVPPSSPSSLPVIQEQDRHSSSDSSPSKLAASAVVSASSSPEESAVESQAEYSDNSNGNGNAAKKSAWSKPSNGGADGGPVMGAFSWPALSESTRASPKSSSSESLKALSDGSISASQGIGIASSSTQKQTMANNASPVSTPNHATPPTRHKSTRRGGGGGNVSVNGGSHQPLPLTLGSVVSSAVEMSANNAGKPGSSVLESSPRDPTTHKETGQTGGFGSHSHNISSPRNDHGQQQRNSFRRGNGGSHPRGDGHYHNNYGGRDRGNHDLNLNRSFNGREGHLQPHRGVTRGGFIRHQPPPHSSTPLIPPPVPVRPFANPIVYPGHHPDSLRSMHLVAPMPPHAMYYSPVLDPQLHTKIVNQIDYYFSNENLIKDTFLRLNMDDQGWVPVILIAGFKKVMQLTENIQLILEAVRASTTVEVQGDKVRRRNDWKRWLMPPVQFPNVSSPQSPGSSSSHDILAANVQNISLEERINKQGHDEAVLSRSSSGDVNSRSQQSSSEETGQATFQAGSESSISAKSSSK